MQSECTVAWTDEIYNQTIKNDKDEYMEKLKTYISDNAKLFRIIDDLDSKGFAFKYESEWISKDICKHFLAEDDKVKVDLYK